MRRALTLMVQGTHSGAGKSVLVAALCRIFADRGLRVAPFKAQNMSLNAAVTRDGLEVGRSTLVQAEAARVEVEVDMNPVLLKPEAERRSQLIVAGRVRGRLDSANWRERRRELWPEVCAAFDRLRSRYDLVILEGAGSPAEINLREGDIVNMAMAEHAEASVLLVGDIDRGGVFAALLGTVELLEPDERRRIGGFILNRFRGDPALLGDGPRRLEERAYGIPTLGLVPYLPEIGLAEEDAVPVESRRSRPPSAERSGKTVDIVVVALPHMANFDDFDPLAEEPGVVLRYVRRYEDLGSPRAVILPGSKQTLADLLWLRERGIADALGALVGRGATAVGICGGYQMLGRWIEDPEGVEAIAGTRAPGLGLLPVTTRFERGKRTERVRAHLAHGEEGVPTEHPFAEYAGELFEAYEIHLGRTCRVDGRAGALFAIAGPDERDDGTFDGTGRVWGTYLHGLFDDDALRHAWLRRLGWIGEGRSFARAAAIRRWAEHVRRHVDLERIEGLITHSGETAVAVR